MELLEGVMAFAVVMIILSTIVTGITEAVLRLLATRQKVLGDAVKSLLTKEILPRVGERIGEKYGVDPNTKEGRLKLAEMFARELTNNVSDHEDERVGRGEIVDPVKTRFGKLRRRLSLGIETLTTYSFLQRIAKSDIGDAFIESFNSRIAYKATLEREQTELQARAAGRAGPAKEAIEAISPAMETAGEAAAAVAQLKAGVAEAAEKKRRDFQGKLDAALSALSDVAARQAANEAMRLAATASGGGVTREALQELKRKALKRKRLQWSQASGPKAAVEELFDDLEAYAGKAQKEFMELLSKRDGARRDLADALERARMAAVNDEDLQFAIKALETSAGGLLGDAAAGVYVRARDYARKELEDRLQDVTRTYERYVAGANEVFKANAHRFTVGVAFAVCIIGNVDAGRVFTHLLDNPETRASLIAQIDEVNAANEEQIKSLNQLMVTASRTSPPLRVQAAADLVSAGSVLKAALAPEPDKLVLDAIKTAAGGFRDRLSEYPPKKPGDQPAAYGAVVAFTPPAIAKVAELAEAPDLTAVTKEAVAKALAEAEAAMNAVRQDAAFVGYGSTEEMMDSITELRDQFGKLVSDDGLPIGSSYYPYCGSWIAEHLAKWSIIDSVECPTEDNNDRNPAIWLLNVLVAGALLSLGGPFWYRVFASLSQVAQMVRQLGGGGRRETIDPDAKEQPASAEAMKKENIVDTFLTAHSGNSTPLPPQREKPGP